jgi:SulP family sulfate permease
MNAIDATGLHAIEHLADRLHETSRTLIICGARDQPARMMARAEFHRHIGEENIQATLEGAIRRARQVLAQEGPSEGPRPKA